MARGMMRGQAILAVMILAAAATACGQFGNLKARKHLKDANALYAQADYRQAAVEYEEAIKADPDMVQAYFYLGNSYDNMYKPARKGEAENDGLLPKAFELAKAISANPDPMLRMTKDLLSKNACEQDMTRAQTRESEYLRACWATPEHKEAVQAFLDKRPARFR